MKARAITAAMIAALLVAMSAGGALMAHGAVTPNPPLVCSSSQGTTGAAHHAGLVVTFGDGRLPQRFCIGFDADSISGVELLQSSPLPLLLVGGGLGAAVCAIDGVGSANNSSYTTCFDTRPNSWAYFHYTFTDGVGAWAFSNRGAGQSPVKDGDVDGWSWGSGVNTPPVPPDGVFAAAATPTDAPTASQTPAPTATVAPTQAANSSSTAQDAPTTKLVTSVP